MNYELEVFHALCETSTFTINGKPADYSDFGVKEDTDRENAPDYGCGNMEFIIDESRMPVTCEEYGITEEEFCEIAEDLKRKLSFGRCGWCI